MNDQQRLAYLKLNHHEFTQKAGCCGPAGVIMGLLEQKPDQVDVLYRTVTQGNSCFGIPNTDRIKDRIAKRMVWGLIKRNQDTTLDHKMTTALTIALKEHLKSNGDEAIWEECLAYSQLFPGWSKGSKLKDLGMPARDRRTALALRDLAFSYKHGDLAMTVAATRKMLDMVGLGLIQAGQFLTNTQIAAAKANLGALAGNGALIDNLLSLTDLLYDDSYKGALIGVAKEAFIGVPQHEKYEYVAHWIYMPQPANRPTNLNVWATEVWTWGGRTTLANLLGHAREYVPKVCLAFRPSTNSYFS